MERGRILFAPTMGGITGGMVLKIRPLALQNGLKIPLEGAFLAQGRINAPPHQQRAASIGVGIVIIHNSIRVSSHDTRTPSAITPKSNKSLILQYAVIMI